VGGTIHAGNAEPYGRFLGQRYGAKPVIWILGGDRSASGYEAVWRAMAKGVAIGVSGSEDYSRVLMTYHPPGGNTSSTWFHSDGWLDFNMLQTGHGRNTDVWNRISNDYNRAPTKPVLDGEPTYEDHPISFNPSNGYATDYDVRKYAYWDLFAGAHGHTYGCHNIWQMYAPGRTAISWAHAYWYDSLDFAVGSRARRRVARLLRPGRRDGDRAAPASASGPRARVREGDQLQRQRRDDRGKSLTTSPSGSSRTTLRTPDRSMSAWRGQAPRPASGTWPSAPGRSTAHTALASRAERSTSSGCGSPATRTSWGCPFPR
jgi:hypothetical protein